MWVQRGGCTFTCRPGLGDAFTHVCGCGEEKVCTSVRQSVCVREGGDIYIVCK